MFLSKQADFAAHHMVVDHAAMAMPEGMPCHPPATPMPGCGKDCPLMAMCATQLLCSPQGTGPAIPLGLAGILLPRIEARLASLNQSPPQRPPKI